MQGSSTAIERAKGACRGKARVRSTTTWRQTSVARCWQRRGLPPVAARTAHDGVP
eukprot:CAMPEP_0171241952 /NCGR_PEP_ID=MMETSP0790-20130122/45388_1 /TAXON_ID=2925 /ORGANISM="Alexandrium catenella, Strain OF101" /LENGTH=54 /DNA_ID=CAMNT_0011708633 /DNA_START=89 /DNA_END=251 /DNA_ORIENTATION=-